MEEVIEEVKGVLDMNNLGNVEAMIKVKIGSKKYWKQRERRTAVEDSGGTRRILRLNFLHNRGKKIKNGE